MSAVAWAHGSDGVRCVSPGDLRTWCTSVELSSYGVPVRSGGSFDVHARPLVSALLPATGPVAGGTRVALLGAPFGEAATLRFRFEASGDRRRSLALWAFVARVRARGAAVS